MFDCALPRHGRARPKLFGDGRPRALDRNAKVRIVTFAYALMRKSEPGRAYGEITAKAFVVLEVLLWGFHNARTGICFPSYERIAAEAGCARSTVAAAIKMLEAAGILTWVNRLARIKKLVSGFSRMRSRVIRTSNSYCFNDPQLAATPPPSRISSKSDFRTGTLNQESTLLRDVPVPPLEPSLGEALQRLAKAVTTKMGGASSS
jgi:hypothetical protein